MLLMTDEPGYVVHSRSYSESSLLLDVFSLNVGKVSLIAKGAKRLQSPLKGVLQPFQPLLLSWQGGAGLCNLRDASLAAIQHPMQGDALYCALYINELLQYLLPPEEPSVTLFGAYSLCLQGLREESDYAAVLREFEKVLLESLGVFPDLSHESQGQAIESTKQYVWIPEHGFVELSRAKLITDPEPLLMLSGLLILQLAEQSWRSPELQLPAKQLVRCIIDWLLNGRQLRSRTLMISARRLRSF